MPRWLPGAPGEQKGLRGYVSRRKPGESVRSFTSTGKIRLWDEAFNPRDLKLSGAKNVHRAVLSPAGSLLATTSYAVVSLWDPATGSRFRSLDPGWGGSNAFLGFRGDSERLWVGHPEKRKVVVWDAEDGTNRLEIDVPLERGGFLCTASSRGRYLALAPNVLDSSVYVYDLARGCLMWQSDLLPLSFGGMAFSHDERYLFVSAQGRCVRVSMADSADRVVPHDGPIGSMAVGPEFLAIGGDNGNVDLFSVDSSNPAARLRFPFIDQTS